MSDEEKKPQHTTNDDNSSDTFETSAIWKAFLPPVALWLLPVSNDPIVREAFRWLLPISAVVAVIWGLLYYFNPPKLLPGDKKKHKKLCIEKEAVEDWITIFGGAGLLGAFSDMFNPAVRLFAGCFSLYILFILGMYKRLLSEQIFDYDETPKGEQTETTMVDKNELLQLPEAKTSDDATSKLTLSNETLKEPIERKE